MWASGQSLITIKRRVTRWEFSLMQSLVDVTSLDLPSASVYCPAVSCGERESLTQIRAQSTYLGSVSCEGTRCAIGVQQGVSDYPYELHA